jgi:HD-GYP domain-containing protein (c-di-GMP phosphodiesterase class II)
MLVLPMRDHKGRLTGVLQFINRRGTTVDGSSRIVPFDEEICELLRAIASQAAVSIQKSGLIRDINQLFESFVQASVKAIEQRDPSTSGHSFRVAETTVALLSALPRSNLSRFANVTLTDEHITEVRYAALLHDFGKVGVREKVLIKANKLSDERLEILHYRFELQKERLRRAAIEQELALLHHARESFETARRRVRRELAHKLSIIDDYYAGVVQANNPNIVADGDFGHLRTIRDYRFRELDGSLSGLITDSDLLALSMRQGSLTPEERREIQLHVVHTKEFLSVLPWPPELARVPEIAGAHHEKLDGSGYPEGLSGEEIPLASRVMTVCDIFDALTAMDRPYKSAMSLDTALKILEGEASDGLLDMDIVEVFIEARCFESTVRRLGPKPVRRPAVLLRAAR